MRYENRLDFKCHTKYGPMTDKTMKKAASGQGTFDAPSIYGAPNRDQTINSTRTLPPHLQMEANRNKARCPNFPHSAPRKHKSFV